MSKLLPPPSAFGTQRSSFCWCETKELQTQTAESRKVGQLLYVKREEKFETGSKCQNFPPGVQCARSINQSMLPGYGNRSYRKNSKIGSHQDQFLSLGSLMIQSKLGFSSAVWKYFENATDSLERGKSEIQPFPPMANQCRIRTFSLTPFVFFFPLPINSGKWQLFRHGPRICIHGFEYYHTWFLRSIRKSITYAHKTEAQTCTRNYLSVQYMR